MRKVILSLCSAALLGLLACSSSSSPAGGGCSSAGDCQSGLSCIATSTFGGDAGCSLGPMQCTKVCNVDADCASLGASFKCFDSCDGSRSCGQAA